MSKLRIADICTVALSIALIGLLLPFQLSNIAMGLFLVTAFAANLIQKKIQFPSKIQWLFAGFFLLFVIGLSYTEDTKYGLKIVERNLVWILIPLVIPFGLKMEKKSLLKAFLAFVVAIHVLLIALLFLASYKYLDTKDSLVFYNRQFTEVIKFHPIYLSVYLLFGMLILFEVWQKKIVKTALALKILIVVFDIVLLILLSSKMALASFVLIFLILFLRSYKSRKAVIGSILGIVMLGVVVMQFPETRNRINDSLFSSWELLEKDTFLYNDPFTGITLRLLTWKFTLQKFTAQENLVIGLGTGDAREFINNVYRDHKMDAGGYINFNMHNQYLEYLLKFGILGLIYYLTILFLCFKKAVTNRNRLYFSFLLIFCIFSITESNLEVQRGIVFFVLINTVFYFFPTQSLEKADA
jgi:O-antigen ligase